MENINLNPQLGNIVTYKTTEDAMIVRGLHMNVVIDKINEINTYNSSTQAPINRVRVKDYRYRGLKDADIMRGVHLREIIKKINEVITTDGLPIDLLDTRLINRNKYRNPDDSFPVRKIILNEIVGRINSLEQSWSSYWLTRYISALSVLTTGSTTQTVTATIVGNGYDGVSFEYSSDNGVTWSSGITDADGVLNQTGLTANTYYLWRARLYKGTNFGAYCSVVSDITFPSEINDADQWAYFNSLSANGASRDGSGIESIYYDLKYGSTQRDAEQNSGNILLYGIYEITATQVNFFYAGCMVGDIFICGTVKTCDANNKVKKVTGNHLTNFSLTAGARPTNRIFNGTNSVLKTATSALAQPITIYLAFKQIGFTNGDRLFDGDTLSSMLLYQKNVSPYLALFSSPTEALNSSFGVGVYQVAKLVFNGTASQFINYARGLRAVVANVTIGTGAGNGFTVGAAANIANFSNIEFLGAIIRSKVDASPIDTSLLNYLSKATNLDRFSNYFIEDIGGGLYAEPTALVSDDYETIDLFLTGSNKTYYLNSSDGLNFSVPQETDIPLGYMYHHILKFNNIYYLFSTHGNDTMHLFSSTDKLNFTDLGEVLTVGGVGDWDAADLGNVFVFEESGTWYMIYEARASYWQIGIATAPAISGPYTKSLSNPVITMTDVNLGNPEMPRKNNDIVKFNGYYYLYLHQQGMPTADQSIHRYKSLDLTTWVYDGICFNNRMIHGLYTYGDHCIIEYKNRTYMFWTVSDQVGTYHVDCGIDNRTIAQLLALAP